MRTGGDGVRELALARWGLPSSKKALFDAATRRADKLRAKGKDVDFAKLLELEPDSGTTNVRTPPAATGVPGSRPANRCLVPFTGFSEPGHDAEGRYRPIWFGLPGEEPLAFFAGVHVRDWSCVRKTKTGLETCDLFAFLTTEPNAEVRAVHPKAMPVILTSAADREKWMTVPWEDARSLQRALPDGALCVLGT